MTTVPSTCLPTFMTDVSNELKVVYNENILWIGPQWEYFVWIFLILTKVYRSTMRIFYMTISISDIDPQSEYFIFKRSIVDYVDYDVKIFPGTMCLSQNQQHIPWMYKPSTKLSTTSIKNPLFVSVPKILNGAYWTQKLNEQFKENEKNKSLRWQYFCSTDGFFRVFPGKNKWCILFNGFFLAGFYVAPTL